MATTRQLALLIDGDNAQAALLPQMLNEMSKYGTAIIRRVYGDWSQPQMKSWETVLNGYALQPKQQFRSSKGKNITDIALVIDAMEILFTGEVNGFCLISSDGDYTPLATRIREKNLFVLGIGRATTPQAFVEACDVFVPTDDLSVTVNAPAKKVPPPIKKPPARAAPPPSPPVNPMKLLTRAFELAVQDNGWADLSNLGNSLRQIDPNFDPRTYGSKQLLDLVKARSNIFEIEKKNKVVYVRRRDDPQQIENLLTSAFELAVQDDGWAALSTLGSFLRQLKPGFDSSMYGHKQLSQLVKAHTKLFKVKNTRPQDQPPVYYVKLKGKR